MDTGDSQKGRLTKIDKFGVITGSLGFVVDSITLIGLFHASNSTQNSLGSKELPFYLWIVVLVSIIYSIVLINFSARIYFHKRALKKFGTLSSQEIKGIEKGTRAITWLTGLPLLFTYAIFILYEDLSRSLYISKDPIFILGVSLSNGFVLYICIAFFIIYWIEYIVKNIYEAFDPLYKAK